MCLCLRLYLCLCLRLCLCLSLSVSVAAYKQGHENVFVLIPLAAGLKDSVFPAPTLSIFVSPSPFPFFSPFVQCRCFSPHCHVYVSCLKDSGFPAPPFSIFFPPSSSSKKNFLSDVHVPPLRPRRLGFLSPPPLSNFFLVRCRCPNLNVVCIY